jgi:lysophospholipase L1-like esterase
MVRLASLVLALTLGAAATSISADAQAPGGRFSDQIDAFAAADKGAPPPACPLLFVGSDSIRGWTTLAHDMTPYPVLNRGVDGADIADLNAAFARLVAPYKPRAIVFYGGDNDLHDGKTPDEVVADFKTFMALKRALAPHVRVYFISVKPSNVRLTEYPAQEDVNRQIKALTLTQHDLIVVDVVPDMMADGKPKPVFVADGLHLNRDGYAIWAKYLRRVLDWTGAAKLKCPLAPQAKKLK